MALNSPRGFQEALDSHEVRSLLPPDLRAKLARDLPLELRQRAFFISGIVQAEILQRVKDQIAKVIGGKMTESEAQSLLKQTSELMSAPQLLSDSRLKLVLSTNIDMARGYGQWKQGQSALVKREFPAQEFYRAENRKEPRDWPVRWAAFGGRFYPGRADYPQGRMIALKDDPIWVNISAFGQPYPPFDFNSGMGIRDVGKEVAAKLRVVAGPGMAVAEEPKTSLHPIRRTFSRTIGLPSVAHPARPSATPFTQSEESLARDAEQARFIQKLQEINAATAEAARSVEALNATLQAKPEVEDSALMSVLQALFAAFASLGIDGVFHEIAQPEDVSAETVSAEGRN